MQTKRRADGMLIAVYLYLFLPVLLFLLGWLRAWIGIPLAALCVYGIVRSLLAEAPLWKPEKSRATIAVIILALAICVLWVLSSGIGASVAQYPDHIWRNGIFKALIDEPWPVRSISADGTGRGLAYYIGFWLPAAAFGKLASYRAGLLFLQIWSVLGIFLVFTLLCERRQKMRAWYLVVLAGFGGLDVVGRFLTGALYEQAGNSLEWWAIFFNYPGSTTHLFWAYNQVICGWLFYLLIRRQKSNKALLFIWSASLLSCTFPAVGLIPFVIYQMIQNGGEKRALSGFVSGVKKTVSIPNLCGVLLAVLFAIYLLPNETVQENLPRTGAATEEATEEEMSGESSGVIISVVDNQTVITGLPAQIEDDGFSAYRWTTRAWMYLWFILLEVGVFFLLLYPAHRAKSLYWLCLGCLLVIPLIKVGYHLDFCERASIPAMLCLIEFVIAALEQYQRDGKKLLLAGLIATLCLGSATAFDTIRGTMAETAATVENLIDEGEDVIPQKADTEEVLFNGSFSVSTETFFYRNLAKKADERG